MIIPIISWIIYAAFIVFFIIISVILNYHWGRYGIHPEKLKKIKAVYFGLAAVVFIIITGLLITIQ